MDIQKKAADLLASLGGAPSAEEIEDLANTLEVDPEGGERGESQMRALAAELRRRALVLRNA